MSPVPQIPTPSSAAPAQVGYLGPEGTFSEEALLSSVAPGAVHAVPIATIYDAVMAVQEGRVQWSLVPIENSIEGSVAVTLDTLASEATDVAVVGELVIAVRQRLIARSALALEEIETVVSHPQATGQCARFLRAELSHADIRSASSTADAVRVVSEAVGRPWAALGTRLAAEIYGCVVLRDAVEDHDDNATRFVWLARTGQGQPPGPPVRVAEGASGALRWKTSLVFWGPGADAPGWLVNCLGEFARRQVNLTKIESRPQRERLGRYMFFLDLDGAGEEPSVRAAITGLRTHCEQVRVLGSYRAAG